MRLVELQRGCWVGVCRKVRKQHHMKIEGSNFRGSSMGEGSS